MIKRHPETDQTFDSLADAASVASDGQLAIDRGRSVWPRFAVIDLPKVGDAVSGAFNGDSYPAGRIARISKTLKVITTTTGQRFYRVRETGCWKENRTWILVAGHEEKRNPSF